MRSEALKKAQRNYEQKLKEQGIKRSKFYQVKCHLEHDADIIRFMDNIENKSGLLKQLIREHMKSQ